MRRRRCSVLQLAAEIGTSHPTVYRWLTGQDIPKPKTCLKLAELSGVPLMKILHYCGHAPAPEEAAQDLWPAFGDYIRGKYPDTLDDDFIAAIEELIEHVATRSTARRLTEGPRRALAVHLPPTSPHRAFCSV